LTASRPAIGYAAGRDFTAAELGMHKLKIERLKKKAVEQGFLDD
jgi:hypothetical protein